MIDARMFSATYPWDQRLDAQMRTRAVVDPEMNDPLGVLNRVELVELGTVVGQEGTDWQNPYAWAATGVLVYPNEHSPYLVPAFGVDAADNYPDVALNIKATQHLAIVDN